MEFFKTTCELLAQKANIHLMWTMKTTDKIPIPETEAEQTALFYHIVGESKLPISICANATHFEYQFVLPLKSLLLQNSFDFATTLAKDTVDHLLDGSGFISLIDFSPRIVPCGHTPEYMIVRAARTSQDAGLKSIKEDQGLLRYLIANKHTSPLELCSVTLCVKMPLVLLTQILRHRTGKFNVFSQRYAEVPENFGCYNPLNNTVDGIRIQHGGLLNKQSSEKPSAADDSKTQIDEIQVLMEEANYLQAQTDAIYHKLIAVKLAPEIARFWLPGAQYTKAVLQFDLNNLLKLLELRMDQHAQLETRHYADAIYELCKPLFPTIFDEFDARRNGVVLTAPEVNAFASGANELEASASRSAKHDFRVKAKRLRS